MQNTRIYFVTGATGAVGSAVVPLLLKNPSTSVRLLLRADTEEQLSVRLEALFQFWGVAPDDADLRSRVKALRGDVTERRFGIDPAEYASLIASCTHIVHSAGNVRMNLSIEEARSCSVGSARNIVELALACKEQGNLQKIEFVSTVGVGGRLQKVPERWITEERGFHNTYEQSKAEAEDYLRQQVEAHGLPVTVHRPSMVVGDAQSGKIIHFQIFYYLCEFLSGRQTLGVLPVIKGTQLDTIPVDYVAEAICWSSGQPDCTGRVFHLCSGADKSLKITALTPLLRSILAAHGQKLPRLLQIPVGLFQAVVPVIKLFVAKKTRKAIGNLSLYLDYASDRQVFSNSETAALLSDAASLEVKNPADYMENLIKAYLLDKRK